MTMGLVQNQVGPSLRWQDKVDQVGQVDPPHTSLAIAKAPPGFPVSTDSSSRRVREGRF